jgi:outer membrane protein
MKKLLFIAVIVFLTGSFTQAQSAVGHVDIQKVLDTMPSRKKAQNEVANFREKAMLELQESEQKLYADAEKLDKERATMSQTAIRFEENRLMKKQQELQERSRELDQQIQILNQELNGPILETVQSVIESVAKTEKLDYVIDESQLLFANGKNITTKVIQEVLKMEREASADTGASR